MTEITDGTAKGKTLSLVELEKRLEALENNEKENIIDLDFAEATLRGVKQGENTVQLTVPDGYKIVSSLPVGFLSGSENDYITDLTINRDTGLISFYAHVPDGATNIVAYFGVPVIKVRGVTQ